MEEGTFIHHMGNINFVALLYYVWKLRVGNGFVDDDSSTSTVVCLLGEIHGYVNVSYHGIRV